MYQDPENIVEMLQKLSHCPTIGDITNLVNDLFPTLIICSIKEYSQDYPHLTENWNTLCGMMNTTPKEIIIFDNYNDNENEFIKQVAEIYTKSGFVVRRKSEYFPAKNNPNKALPNELIYNCFKEKGLKVPDNWSEYSTD